MRPNRSGDRVRIFPGISAGTGSAGLPSALREACLPEVPFPRTLL